MDFHCIGNRFRCQCSWGSSPPEIRIRDVSTGSPPLLPAHRSQRLSNRPFREPAGHRLRIGTRWYPKFRLLACSANKKTHLFPDVSDSERRRALRTRAKPSAANHTTSEYTDMQTAVLQRLCHMVHLLSLGRFSHFSTISRNVKRNSTIFCLFFISGFGKLLFHQHVRHMPVHMLFSADTIALLFIKSAGALLCVELRERGPQGYRLSVQLLHQPGACLLYTSRCV